MMAKDELTVSSIKKKLGNILPENDMDFAVDALGMKLVNGEEYIELLQRKYCKSLAGNMGLSESYDTTFPCDPSVELIIGGEEAADDDFKYRSVIGSLLYISLHTRPYIDVATSLLLGTLNLRP